MKLAIIGQKGIPSRAGGVEIHVEEIASRLACYGENVTVYCRESYCEEKYDKYKGINIKYIPSINTKHLDLMELSIIQIQIIEVGIIFMIMDNMTVGGILIAYQH